MNYITGINRSLRANNCNISSVYLELGTGISITEQNLLPIQVTWVKKPFSLPPVVVNSLKLF